MNTCIRFLKCEFMSFTALKFTFFLTDMKFIVILSTNLLNTWYVISLKDVGIYVNFCRVNKIH